MKHNLFILSILLLVVTGCHHEEVTVPLRRPSLNDSITRFKYLEKDENIYTVDDISEYMNNMYGKEFPILHNIEDAHVDTIFSRNFLPYLEHFYVSLTTDDEILDWYGEDIIVPNIFMYVINFPDSAGYVLAFADKRYKAPLIEFSSSGSWPIEILDSIGVTTENLIYHLPSIPTGSSGAGLADDPLFNHNDANTIYGGVLDENYNFINPLDKLCELYMSVTSHFRYEFGGGGITLDAEIAEISDYKAIMSWNQNFNYNQYLLVHGNPLYQSGVAPLSLLKALTINNFQGEVMGTYYDLMGALKSQSPKNANLLYDLSRVLFHYTYIPFLQYHYADITLSGMGYIVTKYDGSDNNYSEFFDAIKYQEALTFDLLNKRYNIYRFDITTIGGDKECSFYMDCNDGKTMKIWSTLPYFEYDFRNKKDGIVTIIK